jgi:RNA polymerase sigma-70 factor (ECF subfamily)
MGQGSDSATRLSLLGRLQRNPDDPAAWAEFVEQYGRKIYRWCRKWNLQEADAEDVTQNVLAQLAQKLRTFTYDPSRSFRAWLKTLTHHAWHDYLTARRPGDQGSGDSRIRSLLETVAVAEDLTHCLEEAYDHELLQAAMAHVRLRVEKRTWDAFHLLAVENLSGAEVAQRLQMKVATVYVARSKVKKMIQEEIRKLDKPS